MNVLPAIGFISFLLVAVLGGWRFALRSACNADHWRSEVRRGTDRLKGSSLPRWRSGTSSCTLNFKKWKFEGQFAKGQSTQKGSVELVGAFLLLAAALMIVFLAALWKHRQQQVDEHFKQTLCLKHAMLETNFLVRRINRINQVIVSGEATSWALLLTGIGVTAKAAWPKVKKALQVLQDVQYVRSYAEFLKMKNQGCKLPPALWAGPYQWQVRLKRGLVGQALMRKQKQSLWVSSTPLMTHWARWKSEGDLSVGLKWEMR